MISTILLMKPIIPLTEIIWSIFFVVPVVKFIAFFRLLAIPDIRDEIARFLIAPHIRSSLYNEWHSGNQNVKIGRRKLTPRALDARAFFFKKTETLKLMISRNILITLSSLTRSLPDFLELCGPQTRGNWNFWKKIKNLAAELRTDPASVMARNMYGLGVGHTEATSGSPNETTQCANNMDSTPGSQNRLN